MGGLHDSGFANLDNACNRAVFFIALGLCVFALFRPWKWFWPRIVNWEPIDEIDAFRLGQWAAIICGYDYPRDINDDPGPRRWSNTFFFLKRAIQSGRFVAKNAPERRCDRTTLVFRDEIKKFYETVGKREPALFPEEREKKMANSIRFYHLLRAMLKGEPKPLGKPARGRPSSTQAASANKDDHVSR